MDQKEILDHSQGNYLELSLLKEGALLLRP